MSYHKTNHFFDIVLSISQHTLDKRGVHLIKIMEDWGYLFTEDWAKDCFPQKIAWNKNNQGILYISCDNIYKGQNFLYRKNVVMDKLNSYFGFNCIIDVKIK